MTQQDLINSFDDTLEIAQGIMLGERTRRITAETRVLPEGFTARNRRLRNAEPENYRHGVFLMPCTSFRAAELFYSRKGSKPRIAVLNFANPVEPGGGVKRGAMAQEECLCRSSNLYPSLTSEQVLGEYYAVHQKGGAALASDRAIYTPGVTVFKTDDPIPKLMGREAWFPVDVITSAAPYYPSLPPMPEAALLKLYQKRLRVIFEAAIDAGADVLILGAFGCGAFRNPPELMARAFLACIRERRYTDYIPAIVFAVPGSPEKPSPNQHAFENVLGLKANSSAPFYGLDADTNPDLEPYEVLPSGKILRGSEALSFWDWQRENPYYGKYFSILGDSISTYEEYNPEGYAVFYQGDVRRQSAVTGAEDTWWGHTLRFFGGKLLVNNAWSGSRVTQLPGSEKLFPSGCSEERTNALHLGQTQPDVILIFLGYNDWARGVPVSGKQTWGFAPRNMNAFEKAYEAMLKSVRKRYPKAEIWCCTLGKTRMSLRPDFVFPNRYMGVPTEAYNRVIREKAAQFRLRLVDLAANKLAWDTIDGSHPNGEGMRTLAAQVITAMAGVHCKSILACRNDQHDFTIIGQYAERTLYCCRKCLKRVENYDLCVGRLLHAGSKIDGFGMQASPDEWGKTVDLLENTPPHHGETPGSFQPGTLIAEQYRLIQELDWSGMSRVYLAEDIKNHKRCAIKCIKADEPDRRVILLSQAYLRKALRHPVIQSLIAAYSTKSHVVLVLEYMEGETLQSIVERDGPFDAERAVMLMRQLCDAVAYLHTQEPPIIVGDIEPADLLLEGTGQLRMLDFGKEIRLGDSTDITVFASLGYCAPEQFCGQADQRTDVYGIGATLYTLVTGRDLREPPFSVLPIRSINPLLPEGLERIILKSAQRSPDERYQSVAELLYELEHYDQPVKRSFWDRLRGKRRPR